MGMWLPNYWCVFSCRRLRRCPGGRRKTILRRRVVYSNSCRINIIRFFFPPSAAPSIELNRSPPEWLSPSRSFVTTGILGYNSVVLSNDDFSDNSFLFGFLFFFFL